MIRVTRETGLTLSCSYFHHMCPCCFQGALIAIKKINRSFTVTKPLLMQFKKVFCRQIPQQTVYVLYKANLLCMLPVKQSGTSQYRR